MQNRFEILVADVKPIYMIMPRYSHNYALFYQLINSNLFTHRNTYAILREATSETYGPRVYFPSYKFPIYFTLQSLLSIYIIKIPKIFILLSLSDLTFVSNREGLTTALSRWVQVVDCLCRYSVTCSLSPTRLIFLAMGEVLSFGFNLCGVLSQ